MKILFNNCHQRLEITVIDMCRTIRMHPTDYVTIGHMKGLTFLPDANLFDYEAPENECYCPAKVTGST